MDFSPDFDVDFIHLLSTPDFCKEWQSEGYCVDHKVCAPTDHPVLWFIAEKCVWNSTGRDSLGPYVVLTYVIDVITLVPTLTIFNMYLILPIDFE